jgi:hypothetical protein
MLLHFFFPTLFNTLVMGWQKVKIEIIRYIMEIRSRFIYLMVGVDICI